MKKKFFTKLLSIALVCVMMMMCMGAYDGENQVAGIGDVYAVEEEFNANDYEHLTFNAPVENENTINNRSSQALTNEGVIDEAIEFVHNLNLTESGFAYLEEECVLQLEGYKEQDVTLESYTVLVPKSTVGTYYGSYGGNDYYYYYSSQTSFKRITRGEGKSKANEAEWGKWVMGLINIGMNFVDKAFSIPFGLITSVLGIVDNSEILYGAYNEYIQEFYNIQTKIIYRGSSPTGVGQLKYRGQSGLIKFTAYFCPLNPDLPERKLTKEARENVDLNNEFSKDYLLSYFQYTNINGEIMDLNLASFISAESWLKTFVIFIENLNGSYKQGEIE